jgi:hypothetical protein
MEKINNEIFKSHKIDDLETIKAGRHVERSSGVDGEYWTGSDASVPYAGSGSGRSFKDKLVTRNSGAMKVKIWF